MTALREAARHRAVQQALASRSAAAAGLLWARLDTSDLSGSFADVAPQLLVQVRSAQLVAAALAPTYADRVLAEQDLDPSAAAALLPGGFAGTASDGRPLASLLAEPVVTAKVALARGETPQRAKAAGAYALARIVATQVADAGRDAESVALTARPAAQGYVRQLTLPSCSRCAVLAGRFYRWNEGFQRHPLCDCRHVPTSASKGALLTEDPRAAIRSGQVTGLSSADRRAILDDDADVSQVINARRGMYTADMYGRRLSATLEGTTLRGQFGRSVAPRSGVVSTTGRYRRVKAIRLRPAEIYRQAGDDRAEAVRLLRRFGYLA